MDLPTKITMDLSPAEVVAVEAIRALKTQREYRRAHPDVPTMVPHNPIRLKYCELIRIRKKLDQAARRSIDKECPPVPKVRAA